MKPVWARMAAMNFNTVLAALSWELVEPEEGKYDFRLVDGLIEDARRHNLRLVFLWFGSWKNGMSSYIPAWVKRDFKRFPRVKLQNGETVEVLSTLAPANWEADAKAFAALMRHIREVDGNDHTVLMMQVENEVGVLGDSRDRCDAANKAFSQPVPQALATYLSKNQGKLIPELAGLAGSRTSGTWEQVFGSGPAADEAFMAWRYASYVDKVTAVGKAEYPLPMFVNAWLSSPDHKPGDWPSGGPLPHVMDIWRAAVRHIDFLAPDIYEFGHEFWALPHFWCNAPTETIPFGNVLTLRGDGTSPKPFAIPSPKP